VTQPRSNRAIITALAAAMAALITWGIATAAIDPADPPKLRGGLAKAFLGVEDVRVDIALTAALVVAALAWTVQRWLANRASRPF
jgi:hypothetical protein